MKLVTVAAVAGLTDTSVFIFRSYSTLAKHPGRLWGSAAMAGLWGALAVSSACDTSINVSTRTKVLATANAVANTALLSAHIRHNLVTPRIVFSPASSAIALAAALLGSHRTVAGANR